MSEFWSWDRYDSEARRLYDEGDYDRARRVLEEGLRLYPDSAELRVSLGYAELAREEFAWARRWFEEALALESDHEEALAGMGEVLLRLGERSRALLCFGRILELGFGEDADLMLQIGRALAREGLYERARRFFMAAWKADRESAEAAAELAHTWYRLGQVDRAMAWCVRALKRNPEFHETRAFLANLLYDRGKAPEALRHFQRIPPEAMWDALAAWRTAELLRRLRPDADAEERAAPYLQRLDELTTDPSPEEQLLAEVEAKLAADADALPLVDRNQLDLFGYPAFPASGSEVHRVVLSDGRAYEGEWARIVRAMRDDSPDPSVSVAEFMQEEARRLHNLTGVTVPADEPKAFLLAAARLGILQIER